MRLVADENMPLVTEFFAGHEIRRLPGRRITRADLLDADVLLVRSVTRVDRALLEGTPVRFVGTATIGTDHIDLQGLGELGIQVASAPGCNARAVGEYVVTALACLAVEQGWRPEERTVGVVGLGNTGRQVAALAQAMGFHVLGCDPFADIPGIRQLTFPELRGEADILSFHVPLTRGGAHSTYHLVDESVLAGMPAGGILINACRGEVLDGQALRTLLSTRGNVTAVLDVWEGEPRPDPALLERVRFGTPHVAGYSQEGKWRGTEMVYRAFCDFLGQAPAQSLAALLASVQAPAPLVAAGRQPVECLRDILAQACPLPRDDAALRRSMSAADRATAFDELRRLYPARREFTAHRVELPGTHELWPVLERLGFLPA